MANETSTPRPSCSGLLDIALVLALTSISLGYALIDIHTKVAYWCFGVGEAGMVITSIVVLYRYRKNRKREADRLWSTTISVLLGALVSLAAVNSARPLTAMAIGALMIALFAWLLMCLQARRLRNKITYLESTSMKLTYEKLEGGATWWYVKELQPGSAYQMVDSEGNPDPILVQTKSGSAVHFDGFDGLIIEGDAVFAVSLLNRDQKIKVGAAPIFS